jgi:transposase
MPGDIVTADNLGRHKVTGIREAIEAHGAILQFLPADSPDMDPIEQALAKLRQRICSAAPRADAGYRRSA